MNESFIKISPTFVKSQADPGLGTALCRVEGETSQLDLPSLTPLYVAGCGRLQLGAPHWATSVSYCK